jgi:SAM-dependent methyltransferase
MSGYRPDEYWGALLERDDLSRTGHAELPVAFNAWLYRNGARNLDRFLAAHGVAVPARVFDAGIGNGYWVSHWLRRGAERVDGCDLVPAAVARISERFPGGHFEVANLEHGPPTTARYPLVSAMNVLLHITTDDGFTRALESLAALVEPGGRLLLAEPAVRDTRRATPYRPDVHARVRHLSAYAPPGMRLVAVGPTAVLGADPIEGTAIWGRVWNLLRIAARRGSLVGEAAGRLPYLLDPLLIRAGRAPTGKFLLFITTDRHSY